MTITLNFDVNNFTMLYNVLIFRHNILHGIFITYCKINDNIISKELGRVFASMFMKCQHFHILGQNKYYKGNKK